jgi:hypothetical protein
MEGREVEEAPATSVAAFDMLPGDKFDCYISCSLPVERKREEAPVDSVILLDSAKEPIHPPVQLERLKV